MIGQRVGACKYLMTGFGNLVSSAVIRAGLKSIIYVCVPLIFSFWALIYLNFIKVKGYGANGLTKASSNAFTSIKIYDQSRFFPNAFKSADYLDAQGFYILKTLSMF